MLQVERQQNILDYFKEHRTVKTARLATSIYTSEASVRRDLAALEAKGLVERVYGGEILAQFRNDVIPPELRDGVNSAAGVSGNIDQSLLSMIAGYIIGAVLVVLFLGKGLVDKFSPWTEPVYCSHSQWRGNGRGKPVSFEGCYPQMEPTPAPGEKQENCTVQCRAKTESG